jgi:hypothetical protein
MTIASSAIPLAADAPSTDTRTDGQAVKPMTAFPLDALPEPIAQFATVGAASLSAPVDVLKHQNPESPLVVATREAENVSTPGWLTLDPNVLYGLSGEIVMELDKYTEADPVAVLTHLLAEFSCYIGKPPAPHVLLGGIANPLLFWPVNTGETAKGRKGTASKEGEAFVERAFPVWRKGQLRGNLSTGEGLVYAVRDAGCEPGDVGVTDKRLYLVQAEFGSMLKIMAREGNSLSGIIRDAFDGNDLAPLTKNSRVRATNPHIVIVGHVTKDEIRKELKEAEQCNGFANRFVWFAVRRSKVLPFPPARDEARLTELAGRLQEAGAFAQTVRSVSWSAEGMAAWEKVYPVLSEGRPGPVGALIGRAETQVGRLAGLYALLDQRDEIDEAHLKAALALWEYSEGSVEWIFGPAGSNMDDENIVLRALVNAGSISDTAISKLFAGNRNADYLDRLKESLKKQGLAHLFKMQTGGRPCRVWKPGPQPL